MRIKKRIMNILMIKYLTSSLIPQTFSNNQKKGRLSGGSGIKNSLIR